MSRRCALTGKGPVSGNNVSHSQRKSKRRFLPNIQKVSMNSEILGRPVTMRISAAGLRTVEHNGGLDAYLLSTPITRLTLEAAKMKRQLKKAAAKKEQAKAA